MINYYKGTVFNAPVKTYVNAVNCSGIMGSGIALEFKLRYPDMFENYVKECKEGIIKIGRPKLYKCSNDEWILNFPTKNHWRPASKIEYIEEGLKYFVQNYKKLNFQSIAFPKLGTNNGGLDWEEVRILMEKYLDNLDLEIYICLDELKEAEGTEKDMLKIVNDLDIETLNKKLKISDKQSQEILSNMPFSRMWHISKLKSITKRSYEKIFKYAYTDVRR